MSRDKRLLVEDTGAKQVFRDIYLSKAWHSENADRELYSGPGSDPQFAQPYADAVVTFALKNQALRIVDLGCGDFRVGSLIAKPPIRYVGIDVVDEVTAYNQVHHAREGVRFDCLDISTNPLPAGDLCLVREVFQHLSNAQIAAALQNMRQYRWCLVTDRCASPDAMRTPNRDRVQGEKARTALNSALLYDQPPFAMPNVELFMEIDSPTPFAPKCSIRTYLITNER